MFYILRLLLFILSLEIIYSDSNSFLQEKFDSERELEELLVQQSQLENFLLQIEDENLKLFNSKNLAELSCVKLKQNIVEKISKNKEMIQEILYTKNQSWLKSLLQSRDLQKFSRVRSLLVDERDLLLATIKNLYLQKDSFDLELERLSKLQDSNSLFRKNLELELSELIQNSATLKSYINNLDILLANNDKNLEIINEDIDLPDMSKMYGKLIFPTVPNVARDEFMKYSKHLLIPAQDNQLVFPVFEGVVCYAGDHESMGKLIMIDHFGGYISLYANNSELLHQVGDYVGSSDAISRVGRSVTFPDSALYFEIRKDGQKVDLKEWFS